MSGWRAGVDILQADELMRGRWTDWERRWADCRQEYRAGSQESHRPGIYIHTQTNKANTEIETDGSAGFTGNCQVPKQKPLISAGKTSIYFDTQVFIRTQSRRWQDSLNNNVISRDRSHLTSSYEHKTTELGDCTKAFCRITATIWIRGWLTNTRHSSQFNKKTKTNLPLIPSGREWYSKKNDKHWLIPIWLRMSSSSSSATVRF